MSSLCLVVADQLFKNHPALGLEADFLMVESGFLTSKYNYHKFKLSYILTTMREYRDYLEGLQRQVIYKDLEQNLNQQDDFKDILKQLFATKKYTNLVVCEIADKYFRDYSVKVCEELKIELKILISPMFLTSKHVFSEFVKSKKGKRLVMNDFYIQQRLRLGVLVANGKPLGGKWSFDDQNRKKLPKDLQIPNRQTIFKSKHYQTIVDLVGKTFPKNPGQIPTDSWLPVNFEQAERYLNDFCEHFLVNFGDYEDALSIRSDTVFHSCLSTLLNNGLLTPQQVLNKVLSLENIPINSLEGFVRQIIGWREWVKGLYDHIYDENFLKLNHFKAKRGLPEYFYKPSLNEDSEYTQNIPLKTVLEKVDRMSYCHHIERLMILANWMTLSKYKPDQCYRWFVEMFVDSSEWVMVANVMEMGLYADGGIFATKPYVAGGNYLKKMSDYPNSKIWEKIWTDKFWNFLMNHQETFLKNPRMAMLIKSKR
jgi:deoxyribodipyrimidine photolyase-related protein